MACCLVAPSHYLNHCWLIIYDHTIVLFHTEFSPSGEQPAQHILAHKLKQPTASCTAIFHKYCCYTKRGAIMTNLTLQNHWGYIADSVAINENFDR